VIFILSLVGAATATSDPIVVSKDELKSLTFAKLIVRVPGEDWIGASDDALRVRVIEHLRRRGYPALGAESLVFDQDESERANFVLGGTVTEAKCDGDIERTVDRRCRIQISWELLSRAEGRVVYTLKSYGVASGLNFTQSQAAQNSVTLLVVRAVDSLLARPKFVAVLKKDSKAGSRSTFKPAVFRECSVAARPMPASASAVLSASVLVETPDGFGSGAFISPDGLVLTATHVVRGATTTIRLVTGQTLPAAVVRIHEEQDVALLYAQVPGDVDCLALRADFPVVGDEVFAIGSPASKQLAFTLTRGIISGTREIDGVRYLQTDASINPGNSGGPMIDAEGRAVAVVSWKIVGEGMEGIAFGVPTEAARNALGLSSGAKTDEALRVVAGGEAKALIQDNPDRAPTVESEDEERRAVKEQRSGARAKRWHDTPAYVKALGFGGGALVATGSALVLLSWASFHADSDTRAQYETQRMRNDIGWVMAAAGAACVGVALILRPSLAASKASTSRAALRLEASMGVGAGVVRVRY